MKEYKRRRSLSGAVLIMILTVMFVLIILLTATLTTVTTANQRIYTKFEENQAYYTARSALDVFTMNMLDDEDYIAQDSGSNRKYKYGDSGSTTPADLTQGLALQLDLYTIKAQSGHNINQADLDSSASGITDADKKKDEYKTYYGTDSSKVQNNGKPVTDPEYAEYVEYEVELPSLENGSNKYGKLSDKESNIPKAKIKVEILERQYDMGVYNFATAHNGITDVKTYIDSLSDDDLKTFFDGLTSGSQDAKDIASAIIAGNRKKDRMRVKITATTTFDGVEGTAVLIYDTHEPPANNSSRAITAFGGTGSDNFSVVGGMSAEGIVDWGTNTGFIYGSIYAESDFKCENGGPDIHVNSGESVYIGGNLKISNNHFKVINDTTSPVLIDDKNAPFVYVGGKIETGGGIQTSSALFANIDVVTHGLKFGDTIGTGTGGNIYCIGDFEFLTGSNAQINNDIYVTGNLIISGNNDFMINDDGSGNLSLNNFGGSGHIYYGGVVKKPDGTSVSIGAGIADKINAISAADKTKILALPAAADINKTSADEDDKVIELDLPSRSNKKQLRTHSDNYNNYYVKDASGNVILPVQKISAQTMANISTMADKTLPLTAVNAGITTSADTIITNDNHLVFGDNYSFRIDTAGATVQCYLDSGSSKRNGIHISGGGTCELVVSGSYSNETKILVDDDTYLKIIGDTTSSKLWFGKLWVYNENTLEAFKDSSVSLNVGDKNGCGIMVPKINYYISGTQDFEIQTDALLTGYLYAPDANLNFPAAHAGATDINYNGNAIGARDLVVIGSALCKGAKLPNNAGVAYINPDLDSDTPGKPIHDFETFQYVRS